MPIIYQCLNKTLLPVDKKIHQHYLTFASLVNKTRVRAATKQHLWNPNKAFLFNFFVKNLAV